MGRRAWPAGVIAFAMVVASMLLSPGQVVATHADGIAITASTRLVGATNVTYTVEFTIGLANGTTPAGQGDVTVTFPVGYDLSSATFVEEDSTVGGAAIAGKYAALQVSGQQFQLLDFTDALSDDPPTTFVLTFEGITNPATTGNKTLQLQVWSQAVGDFASINTNGAGTVEIVAPSLASFEVTAPGGGPIGDQTAGSAFQIQVAAIDSEGEPFIDLDDAAYAVDITILGDATGATGLGAVTLDFSGTPGTAIHTVRLTSVRAGEVITVTSDASPSVNGASNAFGVAAPPAPPAPDIIQEAGNTPVQVTNRRSVALGADGAATGETTSPDGTTLRVAIPSGAFGGASGIRLELAAVLDGPGLAQQAPPLGGAAVVASFVVRLVDAQGTPVDARFGEPVTLTFTLPAASLPDGGDEDGLLLSFWNGDEWIVVPATVTLNADGSAAVVASVMHFTLYQVTEVPSDWETFAPTPHPTGITLTAWQGGDLEAFEAAVNGASAWVSIDGAWLGYVSGAPAFVNERFAEAYAEGVPRGTYVAFVR